MIAHSQTKRIPKGSGACRWARNNAHGRLTVYPHIWRLGSLCSANPMIADRWSPTINSPTLGRDLRREGRFSFLIRDSRFHGLLNHDAKRGASFFGGAVTRSSDAGGLPRRLPRTPFFGPKSRLRSARNASLASPRTQHPNQVGEKHQSRRRRVAQQVMAKVCWEGQTRALGSSHGGRKSCMGVLNPGRGRRGGRRSRGRHDHGGC